MEICSLKVAKAEAEKETIKAQAALVANENVQQIKVKEEGTEVKEKVSTLISDFHCLWDTGCDVKKSVLQKRGFHTLTPRVWVDGKISDKPYIQAISEMFASREDET